MDNNEENIIHHPHILAIPYPAQGHINPIHQLCKRLASKGALTTIAITNFISKTLNPKPSAPVRIDTFSDGFDHGGFNESKGVEDYLTKMEFEGSKTVDDLIKKYAENGLPIDCVVYDAFLPWALRVAKKFEIKAACFFTQSCSVSYVYYQVRHGMLELPVSTPPLIEIPGLPPLEAYDMPSFIYVHGSYPAYFEMLLNQFKFLEEADFVLINTFYKLEDKVIYTMSRACPILSVGPTIPSDNKTYGINLFEQDSSSAPAILSWLNSKPHGSVIYIAFGSMDTLSEPQVHEIAHALRTTGYNFLWAIRDSSKNQRLPLDFVHESKARDKGFFVNWCNQLEVLSNESIGCFFSHGAWNSTVESLGSGVPMVVLPQWTDQPMVAKLVQDFWNFGVRVCFSNVIAKSDKIVRCLREVMESERGDEMKKNALKWRSLAMEAFSDGGSSDMNMDSFLSQLVR